MARDGRERAACRMSWLGYVERYVSSGRVVATDEIRIARINEEIHLSIGRHNYAMSLADFAEAARDVIPEWTK